MSLALTEEQELLRETALEFIRDRSPVAQLRELRDTRDATGFSRALWHDMAELGWPGILFPEEFGGAGLGYAELGILLEECGRQLVATPFLSTVLLGGNAVWLGGRDVQRKEILTQVCRGERILAFALQEGNRHDPFRIATRAEARGNGYRIQGRKCFVLDGHVADQLVVAARTSGELCDRDGITLFLVDANAPGIERTRHFMVDSRNAASVRFDPLEATADSVIGVRDQGADLIERVLDRATAGLCAEMLGSIRETFARILEYLKQRKQFGVPIGSFQALKHRAALMFCEVELARSAVLDALRALDEERADQSEAVSTAKARCSDTAFLVGNEGIQMFGGIGMTDEEEIGFFLKRARVAQMTFGDAGFHRGRLARLQGF